MSTKTITDVYKQTKRNRSAVKVEVREKGSAGTLTQVKVQTQSIKSDEELLRDFDLTLEYGPCIGISRLERWQRAEKHGLNPAPHIKDIIMKHSDDAHYTQSLWKDYNI